MGWNTFGRHRTIMNTDLPFTLKRKGYNHGMLPVLTGG